MNETLKYGLLIALAAFLMLAGEGLVLDLVDFLSRL